jgi:branched-chain amino acid transport system substrate-binding protein
MSIKRRHALALALPAALAFSALSGCGPRIPYTLKIGVLASMTGSFALRGKDLLNGAQLAADEINASGYKINGQPVKIEIVPADDKGDVAGAKAAADALVAAEVHAVIGPLLTPQAVATIPIFAAKGTPQLFTATAAHLTAMGKGNTFRLQAHDALQGRAMGVFSHENLRGQRIATIVETGDYGQGLNKAFSAAMVSAGKQVTVTMDIDGKGDVTAEMAGKIKAAQADVVVLFAREQQLRSLYKALADVNYTDVSVVGPNVIRNKNVAALPTPVRALFVTATSFDAEEFPAGKPFLAAFSAKFKSEPVWGAHYAYDAVFAVTDAARRAESVAPDALVAKLKSIEPMTKVNQQMRFTAEGEQAYPSVAIYKAERGQWVSQMRSSAW